MANSKNKNSSKKQNNSQRKKEQQIVRDGNADVIRIAGVVLFALSVYLVFFHKKCGCCYYDEFHFFCLTFKFSKVNEYLW